MPKKTAELAVVTIKNQQAKRIAQESYIETGTGHVMNKSNFRRRHKRLLQTRNT